MWRYGGLCTSYGGGKAIPRAFWIVFSFWTSLDSRHYLDIARDGYIAQGDYDRMVQLVFFPGYPVAVRLLSFLLGGQLLLSSFVVSAVSFAGAGCLFYRLMRLDASHEEAVRAVVFLCLLPGVFFFAAPMSESFFLLLAVGSCYAARTGRWFPAGLLGGAAALTRSVGVLLLVPLFFEWMALPRRRGRALGSLLLVPAGFLGVFAFKFPGDGGRVYIPYVPAGTLVPGTRVVFRHRRYPDAAAAVGGPGGRRAGVVAAESTLR